MYDKSIKAKGVIYDEYILFYLMDNCKCKLNSCFNQ